MYKRRQLRKKPARRAGRRPAGAAVRRPRRRAAARSQRFNTNAGSLTQDVFSYGRKYLPARIKAMKGVAAPDLWTANFAENILVTAGTQGFYTYGSLQPQQLKSILDSVPNGAMNRAIVETCQTELTFTNNANVAVELEIYDVMFKRDVPNTLSFSNNTWTYNVAAPSITNLIEYGCKGITNANPLGTPVSIKIGVSPFDSPLFKSYCKVGKRTNVILSSAGSHRHVQLMHINKIAERGIEGSTNSYYSLRGWSYATLVKVKGVAGYAPEATPVTATVTPTFVQMYSSLRVKYSYVADNTNSATYTNTLVEEIPNIRNIGSGIYEPVGP